MSTKQPKHQPVNAIPLTIDVAISTRRPELLNAVIQQATPEHFYLREISANRVAEIVRHALGAIQELIVELERTRKIGQQAVNAYYRLSGKDVEPEGAVKALLEYVLRQVRQPLIDAHTAVLFEMEREEAGEPPLNPKSFTCPKCRAQHDRGYFPPGAVGSYRCLRCGYVGPSAESAEKEG